MTRCRTFGAPADAQSRLHLVNGRPVVSVLLTLAGSGRHLARDLLADTGAGGAQVGFELLLERNDCLLCGGIPVQPTPSTDNASTGDRASRSFPPRRKLSEELTIFNRKATRARAMVALSNDWADHYAGEAMYLRLNGILPPTAQPRKPAGEK